MNFGTRCFALLFLAASTLFAQQKDIIGYYPSWKWRSRNNLVSTAAIPYHKLTIINYAFFYPLPDGRLVGRDTVGDRIALQTSPTLVERAHAKSVKVMLSLGGWEDSNNFAVVAASDSGRTRFASSCLDQIRQYGFDGIDVDWEYPGYADHRGTKDDKKNFTILLSVLRDSLHAYESRTSRPMLLTAALPAVPSILEQYDIVAVSNLLDRLNLMTYDFYGGWSPVSGHNAPLYGSRPEDSSACLDGALRMYTETYGISASKINLGVPFYGHSFADCTVLFTPHDGEDKDHVPPEGLFYYNIVASPGTFKRLWDAEAQVPYLVSSDWKMLVSYDDPVSVKAKADYVLKKGASGLIIWEITGDYLPDGTTPLLDVIYDTFYPGVKK
jgi:chitinase